ncbi:hypothetical protein FC83_GL001928 [Agrilactobacillus composti DSM 18527 = JCM 14202]|uniref:Uncharacterized protein n=1 Tax=Agrilactobacillus composti DSM 18527 = JCM 14202 TaxID=1423734 RepID=X0PMC4_9LACO|nr:hypothetical protein [Agrilactobacillus composti]KRM34791.1 hypothetical protein FC83_GL001928 [Agrilactobacillus composti DSM 18527 = JCM 14202]GAF38642.1 hypothetical protein JCM14202_464 [Agrilactobacillus composti DSM 18527 = JCM 14202]
MERQGRGPFIGSFLLALGTITFNFMQVLLQNNFYSIFQTVTMILFLVTVIYTFTETQGRSLLRRLSWILVIAVFAFNVLCTFLFA